MKTIFNLAEYPSIDLDRLEMGINSGIADATHCGQLELVETLETFRVIVKLARKEAVERESQEFATVTAKQIKSDAFDLPADLPENSLFNIFKGLEI